MTAQSPSPLLETRGLAKAFGGVRAVDGVDFALDPGELRCVIGPNGAGKSTLFKLLLGAIKPDAGKIWFRGHDVTRAEPHRRAHMGIGVKFQHLGVYQELTVRHNLQLPLQHTLGGRAMDEEIARLLARLNLAGLEDEPVGALAHGQKQWLAIGMALAMRPVLLLLDEPTAGMGPEETRETGSLVAALHREGTTIVVVEHDMAFVRQLESPITVLHYGRVFAEGTLSEIERNEDVRNIYLGTSNIAALDGRESTRTR